MGGGHAKASSFTGLEPQSSSGRPARQSLTSLSTAESGLTGLVSAVQVGQAVAALIEEIVGHRFHRCLYGDDQASLAIAQGAHVMANQAS